jgi:hypothetical protein
MSGLISEWEKGRVGDRKNRRKEEQKNANLFSINPLASDNGS